MNLQQFEKDESQNLTDLLMRMNKLHAEMGGRDRRPERVALMKCMQIISREITRSKNEELP